MKGRVLIIDDDDAILQSCRTILEDAGCDVETACGGDAGLAVLRQRSFDVALIDLKMPGKNGLEVLAEATAADSELVARSRRARSTTSPSHLPQAS
jgi:DNA-binding NtrC family response regulator